MEGELTLSEMQTSLKKKWQIIQALGMMASQ